MVCRKFKSVPFALPEMPPWPKERVARSIPFQFTGLDYLGPIQTKFGDNVEKSWICLYMCLAVRAIHLECIPDCTAQAFLDCLTRFISRRGCPERIICDNASQNKKTKTVLDKAWEQTLTDPMVLSYVAEHGIHWVNITELAPCKEDSMNDWLE